MNKLLMSYERFFGTYEHIHYIVNLIQNYKTKFVYFYPCYICYIYYNLTITDIAI